ncbi:MAG: PIN domain-containing protein [Symploca sp. SIO3E6]|nr:PIN domain-containing protein [Caldora sp. SIO3E6]
MVVFPVVLDSCVLYPMYLRDTLLRAAEAGLYQVRWTNEILDGTFRNLVGDGRISPEKAQRLYHAMNQAFPEALIEMTDDLLPCLDNHEGDRHVLAAALVGKAEVIVTDNLRHFPRKSLDKFNVTAQSADEFLVSLLDLSGDKMLSIIAKQVEDLTKPQMEIDELLELLKKCVPRFVSAYRKCLTET